MMKNILLLLFVLINHLPVHCQRSIPVTILGVHHFHNPGADMFNIHQDDIKAPQRQMEVRELVARLLRFQPTKVLVESQFGNTRFPERYRQFLDHRIEDSLSANEIEQVGFRIASEMGHSQVYPFDYRQDMDLSGLQELAATDPVVGEKFQGLLSEMGTFIAEVNEKLKNSSLIEFLVYMNLQENVQLNHQGYLRMLNMTGSESYGASGGVSDWYRRNIHMFYNLNRLADFATENERLLIIVGQGHKAILQDLIEDAEYYHYIDVLEYLR